MSSISNNMAIRQQVNIQQAQQVQQTAQTTSTSNIEGPSGIIRQDTSDVVRMGTAGRLRIREGKQKEKEALQKIRENMSPEKLEKAERVGTQSLANFAKRRRSSVQQEDQDYARQAVEDLIKDMEKEFTGGEVTAMLQQLKDNPVVNKDVILKDAIENKITALIQESLSTQMEIASSGIIPYDTSITSNDKDNVRNNAVLGYKNQLQFLNSLEKDLGIEKVNRDFSLLLSHTMLEMSASMDALASAGPKEKSAVYAAVAGISSLQQLTGVHVQTQRMLQRMSEQYPSQSG